MWGAGLPDWQAECRRSGLSGGPAGSRRREHGLGSGWDSGLAAGVRRVEEAWGRGLSRGLQQWIVEFHSVATKSMRMSSAWPSAFSLYLSQLVNLHSVLPVG